MSDQEYYEKDGELFLDWEVYLVRKLKEWHELAKAQPADEPQRLQRDNCL